LIIDLMNSVDVHCSPGADERSLFELILVRLYVMRKEFIVLWVIDPEAGHFPLEWIASFTVLANFNVRANKGNSVRRPCAKVYQVPHIVLLFPVAITGGFHRISQWGKCIGWLEPPKRHAHWRVAVLQLRLADQHIAEKDTKHEMHTSASAVLPMPARGGHGV
jgi:hypothetical protein